MKIFSENTWDTSGESRSITIDESGMSKIIGIVSSNLYANPASAFREYWLNARESHQATGGGSHPMMITLPGVPGDDLSEDSFRVGNATVNFVDPEPLFRIRDFGTGMNRAELKNMITSAGSSTKDSSNEFGGGMGIGSLSGFSVSDQIVFTAFKDGKRNTVILSAENSSWAFTPEQSTDQPDGVEVSFMVEESEITRFTVGAVDFLSASGFVDDMILEFPRSIGNSRDNLISLEDCFNPGVVEAGVFRIRGVRSSSMSESYLVNNNVLRRLRRSSKSIAMRIDGCFYEGIVPSDMGDTMSQFFVKRMDENIPGFSSTILESFKESSFRTCDFGIADRCNSLSQILVDVPIGVYSREILPSREAIKLSEHDVNTIMEAWVDRLVEDMRPFFDVIQSFMKLVNRGTKTSLGELLDFVLKVNMFTDEDDRKKISWISNFFPPVHVDAKNYGRIITATLKGMLYGSEEGCEAFFYNTSEDVDDDVHGFIITPHKDHNILWEINYTIENKFTGVSVDISPMGLLSTNSTVVVDVNLGSGAKKIVEENQDDSMAVLVNSTELSKLYSSDAFPAFFRSLEDVGARKVSFVDWAKTSGYINTLADKVACVENLDGSSKGKTFRKIARMFEKNAIQGIILGRTNNYKMKLYSSALFSGQKTLSVYSEFFDTGMVADILVMLGVDRSAIIDSGSINYAEIFQRLVNNFDDETIRTINSLRVTKACYDSFLPYRGFVVPDEDKKKILNAYRAEEHVTANQRYVEPHGTIDTDKLLNDYGVAAHHVFRIVQNYSSVHNTQLFDERAGDSTATKIMMINQCADIKNLVEFKGIDKTLEFIRMMME